MIKTKTYIEGLFVIEPKIFEDQRGWFFESYKENFFIDENLIKKFVQDNHSMSKKRGTLRGLHFQIEPYSQTKLVRCIKGKIWDVAVDLRKSSKTYLKWFGVELSANNHKMLLIPKGFAHGFITLEDDSEVQYKVDNYYNSLADRSIRYDDPDIDIKWPIGNVFLSQKDNDAPLLKDSDVNFQ